MSEDLIELLRQQLRLAIGRLPKGLEGLYDTCDFIKTGNNFCHPITWGLLTRIVADLPSVGYIGIDVRFNEKDGAKFQPDVVGFSDERIPVIYVDFESPNSSDARIPPKDVRTYLAWIRGGGEKAPYVIVTSLPDRPVSDWPLLWTQPGQYNEKYKNDREEMRKNPLQFWKDVWARELQEAELAGIVLLNINGRDIVRTELPAAVGT